MILFLIFFRLQLIHIRDLSFVNILFLFKCIHHYVARPANKIEIISIQNVSDLKVNALFYMLTH